MSISLQWEGQPGPAHVDTLETANHLYDFIPQALHRIEGVAGTLLAPQTATVAPLATGGGMAVYTVCVHSPSRPVQTLICKIPHQRRIVYTTDTNQHTTAS